MDVEIHPSTGAPFPLTGDRPEEGVSGGRLAHDRAQEMIPGCQAPAVKGEDYGNESHRLNFTITREHADEGEASLYATTHAKKVPPKGRVKLIHRRTDGSVVGVSWLEDAVINTSNGDWDGCSTTFHYDIQGGAMTAGS